MRKQSINIKLTEILQPSKTTFQLLAKLHGSIQQLSISAFLPNSTTACTGEDEEGDYNCTFNVSTWDNSYICFLEALNPETADWTMCTRTPSEQRTAADTDL